MNVEQPSSARECRVNRGGYCNDGPRPYRIWCKQGRDGVMFWGAIFGNELVGPFRVADGVKMAAKLYVDFNKEHLEPLHKKDLSIRKKTIFIYGNVPSQADK